MDRTVRYGLAVCAALLLAPLAALHAGEQRDLILVAGQSNAVGFDAYPDDLPLDPSDKAVLFWWRCGDPPPDEHDSTSERKWTQLQVQPPGNPMSRNSGQSGERALGLKRQYGNFKKPEGGFGPEIGFARELRAKQGKPLAIVKAAFSGTGMRTDWNPADAGDGGACYRALVAETKAAIAAAAARGITLHLRAILWVQGESDANLQDAPNYQRALAAMLAALRKDLDAPQLIALLGVNTRFGNDKNPFVPKVIEAQRAIAARDNRCAYVDTAGADTLLPTGAHFTAAGTLDVGKRFAKALLELEAAAATQSPDLELSETLQLPECHSIGWVNAWVKANPQARGRQGWDGVVDKAKWGVPSPQQLVVRDWDWQLTDEQWRQAVKQKGEGKKEDVKFDLWLPGNIAHARGIVVISGHGSGEGLYRHAELRRLARELHLALFKFIGNPMQRGFWPKSLLYERLTAFAEKAKHPELNSAPLFLYGHSNGTGFSAIFPATEGARVWAWVSMRPGITFQVVQPGGAQVPGLVIFGEDDQFLARPSKEENLAVVPLMRKKHHALWSFAVEPKTGHGPGEKTWPLVFSFLRHTFAARMPAGADPRQGPVKLVACSLESGHLGQNWDVAKGGYQTLPVAPFANFIGDKSTASWLINAAYAADWQAFQRDGQAPKSRAPAP